MLLIGVVKDGEHHLTYISQCGNERSRQESTYVRIKKNILFIVYFYACWFFKLNFFTCLLARCNTPRSASRCVRQNDHHVSECLGRRRRECLDRQKKWEKENTRNYFYFIVYYMDYREIWTARQESTSINLLILRIPCLSVLCACVYGLSSLLLCGRKKCCCCLRSHQENKP